MERLYLELPSIERKEEAIEYINEFVEANSQIHGAGSLDKYLKDKTYEEWLEKSKNMVNKEYTDSKGLVPSVTYFLIRESDNRLIGMIDLRLGLNDFLRNYGGHIGYGIRPSERRKGYNKINLYLCLEKAKEFGLDQVLLTCADFNDGSRRTIKALGGVYEKEQVDPYDNELMELYWIDVDESLEKYKDKYKISLRK